MAKILKFRPMETGRLEGGAMADEATSAEVIVFPGVRYERWDHSDDRKAPSATNKRSRDQHRDVLELAE